MKKIIAGTIILLAIILSACNETYENHALAIRNSTNDSIQVDRYYSSSLNPRTVYIGPNTYEKFYETSSDLWITPQVELEKICDSLVITGNNFRICFNADIITNYGLSPYASMADWEHEVIIKETPKFLGKQLERFNIHIYEIIPGYITMD